jgi:hypothetical protein
MSWQDVCFVMEDWSWLLNLACMPISTKNRNA